MAAPAGHECNREPALAGVISGGMDLWESVCAGLVGPMGAT